MVLENESRSIVECLDNLIKMLDYGIKTRNNNYYFFVCSSLIGSQKTIELPCQCGYINKWKPPHNNSDLFCIGCGSSFNIMAMDGDPGYIITSNGPARVIGSSAPDFKDLPFSKQQELMQKVAELKKSSKDN
jgi:hypothetical protein